jgi:hypothetical protein
MVTALIVSISHINSSQQWHVAFKRTLITYTIICVKLHTVVLEECINSEQITHQVIVWHPNCIPEHVGINRLKQTGRRVLNRKGTLRIGMNWQGILKQKAHNKVLVQLHKRILTSVRTHTLPQYLTMLQSLMLVRCSDSSHLHIV